MADNPSDFVPTPTPAIPSSKPWHSEQPCANLSSLPSRLCLQLSAPWLQLPPAFLAEGAAPDTEGCSFLVSKQSKGRPSSIQTKVIPVLDIQCTFPSRQSQCNGKHLLCPAQVPRCPKASVPRFCTDLLFAHTRHTLKSRAASMARGRKREKVAEELSCAEPQLH